MRYPDNGGACRCIICSKCSMDGISVLGKFICCECEKNIVNTDICDGKYEQYKEIIKRDAWGSTIVGKAVR